MCILFKYSHLILEIPNIIVDILHNENVRNLKHKETLNNLH